MLCSNEPGYYKEDAYGIRLENLVLVTPADRSAGGDRDMMGFETVSLCPFDRRLVVKALLGAAERQWLDAYHARVAKELSPLVDSPTGAWLAGATAPIA